MAETCCFDIDINFQEYTSFISYELCYWLPSHIDILHKLFLKLNKSEEPFSNIRSINTMNQVFNKRQNTVKRTQCVVSLRRCYYIDLHRHSEKQIKF